LVAGKLPIRSPFIDPLLGSTMGPKLYDQQNIHSLTKDGRQIEGDFGFFRGCQLLLLLLLLVSITLSHTHSSADLDPPCQCQGTKHYSCVFRSAHPPVVATPAIHEILLLPHRRSRTATRTTIPPPKMSTHKPGRKGDVRMHRAVAARLANPHLTLYQALVQGGFVYEKDEDSYDAEHVRLGQRKNQLSRRVRFAQKKRNNANYSSSSSSSAARKSKRQTTTVNYAQWERDEEDYEEEQEEEEVQESEEPTDATTPPSNDIAYRALTQTATAAGLSLHQLAVLLQHKGVDVLLGRSTFPLIPPPRNAQEQDQRLQQAVSWYHQSQSTLHQRALEHVGLPATPGSRLYQEFVLRTQPQEASFPVMNNNAHGGNTTQGGGAAAAAAVATTTTTTLPNSTVHSHNHAAASTTTATTATTTTAAANTEPLPCTHTRHVHLLQGKCGHKAILHQPPDGNPHIDFVVNDKVECYHGLKANDGMWPSANCDKESCQEITSKDPAKPQPKLFNLNEISMDGDEWVPDFQEDEIMGLFRLSNSGGGATSSSSSSTA